MRRYIRISLVVTLLALVSCHVYPLFLPDLHAHWHRQEAEAKSIAILQKASTNAELEQAVGDLGLFVSLPDGEWIAIRYCDSHSNRIWSSAVARDSKGEWWISDRHFCGKLQAVREQRKMAEDTKILGMPDSSSQCCIDQEILQFANSKTLSGARKELEEMGFQQFQIEREN